MFSLKVRFAWGGVNAHLNCDVDKKANYGLPKILVLGSVEITPMRFDCICKYLSDRDLSKIRKRTIPQCTLAKFDLKQLHINNFALLSPLM